MVPMNLRIHIVKQVKQWTSSLKPSQVMGDQESTKEVDKEAAAMVSYYDYLKLLHLIYVEEGKSV